jgi:hypothetical protein
MPGKLPETKLFSVEMGKGACCDCGKLAETQFVITTGKGEAKRLGGEAKKARSVGTTASDVGCGLCIANRIAAKELFVTEVLKSSPVKWERIPVSTVCLDCGKDLPFGAWAHWHGDTGQAICGDCGVHRGWTDKTLANLHLKSAELKADIGSLRKRYKTEVEGLYLLEEKVDLHQLAQSYIELENKIVSTISKLESYLNAVATGREKVILESLEREINVLQDLAQEVSNAFKVRLLLLDEAERKHKIVKKIFDSADSAREAELEELRYAEGSMAEVPAQ